MESLGSAIRPSRSTRIIDAFAATDVGYEREHNEDAFLCDGKLGIFIIADGVGGHAGGEVASSFAVKTLHAELLARSKSTPLETALQNGFREANRAVMHHAMNNPELRGMATTLLAGVRLKNEIVLAHAGDSRAYLYHRGNCQQLTRDHSSGPYLSNAIGMFHGCDIVSVPMHEGAVLVLATDGLSNAIDPKRVFSRLSHTSKAKEIVSAMIAGALREGGPDNVTVCAIRFG